MERRTIWITLGLVGMLGLAEARAEDQPSVAAKPAESQGPDPVRSRRRGLAWLAGNQNEDGSWGQTYSIATTALACLSRMADRDDPFAGEDGQPFVRGIRFLLARAADGGFPKQGHTWIHGQGIGTLALAEAYGRIALGKTKPDLDADRLRKTLVQAVDVIARNQSTSGGWWYTRKSPSQHEGSTTVCAVQALVSAANFGIPIDERVLAKGFEYLKRCQNDDGGFDYKLGDAHSMKEGTAAGVSTLALMRRFDYRVMTEGVGFLRRIGPGAISKERFPYYGHFYASMGLKLFGEEMGAEKDASAYIDAAHGDVLGWQGEDGAWPIKGWMRSHTRSPAYPTAFAALLLGVPDARLSIFNRRPPALPD